MKIIVLFGNINNIFRIKYIYLGGVFMKILKIQIGLIFLSMLLFSCASVKPVVTPDPVKNVEDSSPNSKYNDLSSENLQGFWRDKETNNLIAIQNTGDGYKISSIVDYDDSEEMKVVKLNHENGVLSWTYHVPSTNYYVSMKTMSLNNGGKELLVEWSNDHNMKGTEILHREGLFSDAKSQAKSDKFIKKSEKKKKKYKVVGKIYKLDMNKDVIVAGKIGGKINMGDKLFIEINNKKVYMKVYFPMMTIAKCKLIRGGKRKFKLLKKNMIVYK
jgi:hypothetical protein